MNSIEIKSTKDLLTLYPNANKKIISRLNSWLDTKKEDKKHSCAGFLYYLLTGKEFGYAQSWTFKESKSKRRAVYLSGKNERDFHFAYRLGKNKYLSQFGNGGLIIVTSLSTMNDFFETSKLKYVIDLEPQYL